MDKWGHDLHQLPRTLRWQWKNNHFKMHLQFKNGVFPASHVAFADEFMCFVRSIYVTTGKRQNHGDLFWRDPQLEKQIPDRFFSVYINMTKTQNIYIYIYERKNWVNPVNFRGCNPNYQKKRLKRLGMEQSTSDSHHLSKKSHILPPKIPFIRPTYVKKSCTWTFQRVPNGS